MPASTTKPKAPTAMQYASALEKARIRVLGELGGSSYAPIAELVCKLMIKYAREEANL